MNKTLKFFLEIAIMFLIMGILYFSIKVINFEDLMIVCVSLIVSKLIVFEILNRIKP
jgi:hypothetical protein